MLTNLRARVSAVEQQNTAEQLGLGPVSYNIQETEWVVFEPHIRVMEVDVEVTEERKVMSPTSWWELRHDVHIGMEKRIYRSR